MGGDYYVASLASRAAYVKLLLLRKLEVEKKLNVLVYVCNILKTCQEIKHSGFLNCQVHVLKSLGIQVRD